MGLSQQFISELCFSYVNDEELDLMTILSPGIWHQIAPEARHFCPLSLQPPSPHCSCICRCLSSSHINSPHHLHGHGVGSWQLCSYNVVLPSSDLDWMVQEWAPDPGPMWDPPLGMETWPKTDGAQSKLLRSTSACGTAPSRSLDSCSLSVDPERGWFLASSAGRSLSLRTVWFPDGFPVLGPSLSWGSLHGCPWVLGDTRSSWWGLSLTKLVPLG